MKLLTFYALKLVKENKWEQLVRVHWSDHSQIIEELLSKPVFLKSSGRTHGVKIFWSVHSEHTFWILMAKRRLREWKLSIGLSIIWRINLEYTSFGWPLQREISAEPSYRPPNTEENDGAQKLWFRPSVLLYLFFSAHIWLHNLLLCALTYGTTDEALHTICRQTCGIASSCLFTVCGIYWLRNIFFFDVKADYYCGGYLDFNYSFSFIPRS